MILISRYKRIKGFCVDEHEEYEDMIIIKIVMELVMSGLLLLIPLIITTALYSVILVNIYKNGQRFLRYDT